MKRAFVWWSIYVRTTNRRKLRSTHVAPIEQALEGLPFEWQIFEEQENPGLTRMINYQNLSATSTDGIILPVLKRAYALANTWQISGLGDLSRNDVQHVAGYWRCTKPQHYPPALDSVVFEVQPGQILGMSAEGGWKQVDAGDHG